MIDSNLPADRQDVGNEPIDDVDDDEMEELLDDSDDGEV